MTSGSVDEHLGWFLYIGEWKEVTELARKWNPEMEMVPWPYGLLIWQSLDAKRQLKTKKYFRIIYPTGHRELF